MDPWLRSARQCEVTPPAPLGVPGRDQEGARADSGAQRSPARPPGSGRLMRSTHRSDSVRLDEKDAPCETPDEEAP
jgi:hypothetical protein